MKTAMYDEIVARIKEIKTDPNKGEKPFATAELVADGEYKATIKRVFVDAENTLIRVTFETDTFLISKRYTGDDGLGYFAKFCAVMGVDEPDELKGVEVLIVTKTSTDGRFVNVAETHKNEKKAVRTLQKKAEKVDSKFSAGVSVKVDGETYTVVSFDSAKNTLLIENKGGERFECDTSEAVIVEEANKSVVKKTPVKVSSRKKSTGAFSVGDAVILEGVGKGKVVGYDAEKDAYEVQDTEGDTYIASASEMKAV